MIQIDPRTMMLKERFTYPSNKELAPLTTREAVLKVMSVECGLGGRNGWYSGPWSRIAILCQRTQQEVNRVMHALAEEGIFKKYDGCIAFTEKYYGMPDGEVYRGV